ncbi:hypothetical protein J5N97_008381 [Dioscorea zingiberensis]|uniref:Cytochrome P450 n=1 Tax=Dioscorea zingiberensis TaxID=325984 RepID=A0A9D5CV14_9LILI|nr:hypothetical protein J5N97_008381 [Dioscorea zingiberensis]
MEHLMILSSCALFILSIFILFKLTGAASRRRSSTSRPGAKLPPGPWRLPIIGNLHNMVGSAPHERLTELAKKHGPLMHLKLGQVSTIVVSSRDVAREMMKTHDLCISDRPVTPSIEIFTYGGQGLIFTPYGEYWRQMRKICVLELLSQKRVQSFRSIREEEVSKFIHSIYSEATTTTSSASSSRRPVVNISEKLATLTNNVITRVSVGKLWEDRHTFLMALDEAGIASAGFNVADFYPSLKFLTKLTGLSRRLKRNHWKLDSVFQSVLREHELRREETKQKGVIPENEDLVDVLLRVREEGGLQHPLTMEGVKSVIFDIFGGGTETSSNTMEWAMAEMIRNPEVMNKAQSEVREVLQGKTEVTEEDIDGLNYLKLVIKETLRLHTPAPLLLPRECRETCEVMGYQVPAGAKVLVNAWAMSRDPAYWDEPLKFWPERFEQSTAVNFNGSCYEFIPFGSGRRMCPGMLFGLANVELPLAQLLYYFDWKLPNGLEADHPQELDMSDSFGVLLRKKLDLLLLPLPRGVVPCPKS